MDTKVKSYTCTECGITKEYATNHDRAIHPRCPICECRITYELIQDLEEEEKKKKRRLLSMDEFIRIQARKENVIFKRRKNEIFSRNKGS